MGKLRATWQVDVRERMGAIALPTEAGPEEARIAGRPDREGLLPGRRVRPNACGDNSPSGWPPASARWLSAAQRAGPRNSKTRGIPAHSGLRTGTGAMANTVSVQEGGVSLAVPNVTAQVRGQSRSSNAQASFSVAARRRSMWGTA